MSAAQLESITREIERLYAGWSQGASIAQIRTEWEAYLSASRLPATRDDVDAGGLRCRWVRAGAASENDVILYLHGGGYQTGSLDSHHNVMAALSAASGASVLGVDYRLAPEHRFPAPVEDAMQAWRWMLRKKFVPARVSLAGDSAGAGLAVALMTLLRDRSMPLPAATVALCPWVDMEARGQSYDTNASRDAVAQRESILMMARAYLGKGGDPRAPLASPIHANLARLPPLLVQAGSHEVLLDDARLLVERASSQGVNARLSVWEGMVHAFHLFAGRLDEADSALQEAGRFVRQHIEAKAIQP